MNENLPKVLILGGCGFVGRNFLQYLLLEELVSFVRVVDKITPQLSDMHPNHLINYSSSKVEFLQVDLSIKDHLNRVFKINNEQSFDYVFNTAGESRYGQPENIYAARCSNLSRLCALKSIEFGIKRFIELSTAHIYDSKHGGKCHENSPINPIITQAKYKYEAEQILLQLCHPHQEEDQLDVVILRPSNIYGCGDLHLPMTRIACAALYQYSLHEIMTLPFSSELEINTVHIHDVCRAMWFCINQEIIPCGSIFNLCDKNNTTQEIFTEILSEILGVRYDYHGYIINTFLRHRPNDVVEYINRKHIKAWDYLCQFYNISNTPISPYLTSENLLDIPLSVDGSLIESFGFQYNYPILISEEIRKSIMFAIETGIFPAVVS